ncbi:hypothetical protein JL720_13482 [Aureococcus anophagefferens]|nr:hypothetical protein JL720_13482 [Aureococcus anophagefferens]
MPMALLDDAARPRPRAGCLLALGAACAALAYVGAGARDGGATLSLAVGAAAGAERFALPDPATVVVAPLDDRFALAGGEEYFSMTGRLLDREVATETDAVFDEVLTEAEAWEALSVADFRAHCANVTFGYCGRSTCHIDGAKESSTCGCKKIVNGAGSIGFNSRNAYLIRSALVRRALYEITVLNETSYFVNTVCGAIKNKRFWHEAGFDSDFGSMSDAVSDADYGGYWAMVDLDCPTSDAEYNFAYCDGAPCDIAQAGGTAAFDANYDSMCICPYASANATSVLHEHITDGGELLGDRDGRRRLRDPADRQGRHLRRGLVAEVGHGDVRGHQVRELSQGRQELPDDLVQQRLLPAVALPDVERRTDARAHDARADDVSDAVSVAAADDVGAVVRADELPESGADDVRAFVYPVAGAVADSVDGRAHGSALARPEHGGPVDGDAELRAFRDADDRGAVRAPRRPVAATDDSETEHSTNERDAEPEAHAPHG